MLLLIRTVSGPEEEAVSECQFLSVAFFDQVFVIPIDLIGRDELNNRGEIFNKLHFIALTSTEHERNELLDGEIQIRLRFRDEASVPISESWLDCDLFKCFKLIFFQ